jgi:peptidoglycan hydrolase CwlO-like protein
MLKNPIAVLLAALVALALSIFSFVQMKGIEKSVDDLEIKVVELNGKFEWALNELATVNAHVDSVVAEIKIMKKRLEEIEDD